MADISPSTSTDADTEDKNRADDVLSQGMEALKQTLAETLAGYLGPSGSSGNVANYMGQMAMAMGKAWNS